MEIKVLVIDGPAREGNIFSEEEVRKSILENKIIQEQLKNKSLYIESMGLNEANDEVDSRCVMAVVNDLYIKDKVLYMDAELLDTPIGKKFKDIADITMIGYGNVDKDKKVSDYTFTKFIGFGHLKEE